MRYIMSDFETCTYKDGVRVWLWGLMDIENNKVEKMIHGGSIESFTEHIMGLICKDQNLVYFHNLAYDGTYIIDHLLRCGYKLNTSDDFKAFTFSTLISSLGQFYSITIYGDNDKHFVRFVDSVKLVPLPLEAIGEVMDIPKLTGTIDYEAVRVPGYKANKTELEYLHRDLLIGKRFIMSMFLKKGYTHMTLSGNAYSLLKNTITEVTGDEFYTWFPMLSNMEYEALKRGYKGGICNIHRGIINKPLELQGSSYDFNSLYPSMMILRQMPYGKPRLIPGLYEPADDKYNLSNIENCTEEEIKHTPLYTISLKAHFTLKPNGFECLYNNTSNGFISDTEHIYPNGYEYTGTIIDWYHIKRNYYIDIITIKECYVFDAIGTPDKEETSIFYEFIDGLRAGKIDAELDGDMVSRLLYKLLQNSSYGKFGTSAIGDCKVPYIDEEDKVNYMLQSGERDTEYMPVAMFITSWARNELLNTCYKVGYDNFLYCDTDSIHTTLNKAEFERLVTNVHNTKYGYLKFEYNITKGKYLKPKAYYEVTENKGKVKNVLKCAGMGKDLKKIVTFDDFNLGTTWVNGNLKNKNVKGGKMLYKGDFSLKGESGKIFKKIY